MEFSELVKLRQSDRKYLDTPVEEEKIRQCIEAARLSPSSNNSQPWKFVVVDDPALLGRIAEAGRGMNRFMAQAPVVVAVVMERPNVLSALGSVIQDKEYALLDIGIAANQLCLQAADLGLGTCMVGWFDEKGVRRLLGIGRGRRIPLLITIGYSASPTRPKSRKPTGEVCSRNKY